MDTFNFESLNLKKVKKAIDIGCGNGRHLKSLGFRLKKAEIFGVDQLEHEIHKLNNEFDTHVCKNGNSYSFRYPFISFIDCLVARYKFKE